MVSYPVPTLLSSIFLSLDSIIHSPMTSAVPAVLISPKPIRTSLVSALPHDQPNFFLSQSKATDSDEGLLVAKEISQIVRTRGAARQMVGNKQSPGQGRRLGQVAGLPQRCEGNPMLSDSVFREMEETVGDFPWN